MPLYVLRSQIVKEGYFSPRRAAKKEKGRAVEENCSRRLARAPVCIRPAACIVQQPQWVLGVPRAQLKLRKTQKMKTSTTA